MTKIIDMRFMRYINAFEKVCHISTTDCFIYNNIIIFAVSKSLIFKAVGKDGINIKKIAQTFGKKIKVIESAKEDSMSKFITDIVEPAGFREIEVKDGVVCISAGRQNKVELIGRNKSRLKELEEILKKYYNIQKVKII